MTDEFEQKDNLNKRIICHEVESTRYKEVFSGYESPSLASALLCSLQVQKIFYRVWDSSLVFETVILLTALARSEASYSNYSLKWLPIHEKCKSLPFKYACYNNYYGSIQSNL